MNGPVVILLAVVAAWLFYGTIIYFAGVSAKREIERRRNAKSERTGA